MNHSFNSNSLSTCKNLNLKFSNKYEKTLKDAAWTRYVKDGFLCELAKNLGFKETKEGIYGVDIIWEKPSEGVSVAIEHENDIKSIWNMEG